MKTGKSLMLNKTIRLIFRKVTSDLREKKKILRFHIFNKKAGELYLELINNFQLLEKKS